MCDKTERHLFSGGGALERVQHSILSVDRVSALEQVTRRLLPHNVSAPRAASRCLRRPQYEAETFCVWGGGVPVTVGCRQEIGGIGLALVELLDFDRPRGELAVRH